MNIIYAYHAETARYKSAVEKTVEKKEGLTRVEVVGDLLE